MTPEGSAERGYSKLGSDARVVSEILRQHINHTLEELAGKAGAQTIAAFRECAGRDNLTLQEMFTGLIQRYLERGESLNQIHTSSNLSISVSTLAKTFRILGVPMLTRVEVARRSMARLQADPEVQARRIVAVVESWGDPMVRERRISGDRRSWEDPGVRSRRTEGIRKANQNPEARERKSEATRRSYTDSAVKAKRVRGLRELEQDPEALKRRNKAISRTQQNPEVRIRKSEILTRVYEDPEVRARVGAAVRRAFEENPEYRERQIEAIRRLWLDDEYRRRHAERTRRTLSDPRNAGRWPLPTIQGVRRDVGYAQSTWEANLARVLIYCSRDFIRNEQFALSIPEEYRNLFNEDSTNLGLDFVVLDPRGNFVGYEIMAHPKENPRGWVKVDMFSQQHSYLPLHLVTPRFYYRLRDRFADRINSDSRFAGWETLRDNLRTNPEKYAAGNL